MKKAETLIQDAIIEHLNKNRILHWRMSGASNMAGFPDLLLCYKGKFVALEIKTPIGSPTMQQTKTIADIKKAGGHGFIVTSVEDVINVLKGVW